MIYASSFVFPARSHIPGQAFTHYRVICAVERVVLVHKSSAAVSHAAALGHRVYAGWTQGQVLGRVQGEESRVGRGICLVCDTRWSSTQERQNTGTCWRTDAENTKYLLFVKVLLVLEHRTKLEYSLILIHLPRLIPTMFVRSGVFSRNYGHRQGICLTMVS